MSAAIPLLNMGFVLLDTPEKGGAEIKLWQSCTIGSDIAPERFRLLARRGGLGANTLHTLSGFPGLGI
jgi:hypothetical protein